MTEPTDDIDKLYEFGERLNDAKDKSLVRVQAIRGLPLFCKDTPEQLSKIVDILGQLLVACKSCVQCLLSLVGSDHLFMLIQLLPIMSGENVERDAVHKALMTVSRQDVKTSLTALFKRVGSIEDQMAEDLSTWESIREKVLFFLKDKVFPLKMELLVPQEPMERHITTLVKQNLQDVTAAEFKMFMDFLKSLSLFGHNAPAERIQELVEGQADLDAQFNIKHC